MKHVKIHVTGLESCLMMIAGVALMSFDKPLGGVVLIVFSFLIADAGAKRNKKDGI